VVFCCTSRQFVENCYFGVLPGMLCLSSYLAGCMWFFCSMLVRHLLLGGALTLALNSAGSSYPVTRQLTAVASGGIRHADGILYLHVCIYMLHASAASAGCLMQGTVL
jgi:hypothetical protein